VVLRLINAESFGDKTRYPPLLQKEIASPSGGDYYTDPPEERKPHEQIIGIRFEPMLGL